MYVNYLSNGSIDIVSGTYHSAGVTGAGYGYNIGGTHFAPAFDRAVTDAAYLAAWNAADDKYFINNGFSNTSTPMQREMGVTLTLADLIGFGVAPGGSIPFNINDTSAIWSNNGAFFQLAYNPTTTVTTTNPSAAVPAPSVVFLLAIGLVGLASVSRSNRQDTADRLVA